MATYIRNLGAVGGLMVALLGAGCGPGGPGLTDVEGTVTLDGEPLEGARVIFRPEEGRPSIGETDTQGRYQLSYTKERTGALPGKPSAVQPQPNGLQPRMEHGMPSAGSPHPIGPRGA